MVPLYYVAYRVGALLLGIQPGTFAFELSWNWLQSGLGAVWKPFLVGCLVCGVVGGYLAYLGAGTGLADQHRQQAKRAAQFRQGLIAPGSCSFPSCEHQHPFHSRRQPRVVRDDHEAGAPLAVQLQHQLEYLRGIGAIQVAGGFVGQHQPRLGNQRARHCRPLPLATGQLVRPMGQALAQAHPLSTARARSRASRAAILRTSSGIATFSSAENSGSR